MKGILFSAPMVLAILEGRKTQTRRIVTPQPTKPTENYKPDLYRGKKPNEWAFWMPDNRMSEPRTWFPQYQPGETIAVREAFKTFDCYDHMTPKDIADIYDARKEPDYLGTAPLLYLADQKMNARGSLVMGGTKNVYKWGRYRHARFMPAALARLHITIAAVRIERLHDITEEDARAEGVTLLPSERLTEPVEIHGRTFGPHFIAFSRIWNSINGPDSWAANPWIWAYTFRKITP